MLSPLHSLRSDRAPPSLSRRRGGSLGMRPRSSTRGTGTANRLFLEGGSGCFPPGPQARLPRLRPGNLRGLGPGSAFCCHRASKTMTRFARLKKKFKKEEEEDYVKTTRTGNVCFGAIGRCRGAQHAPPQPLGPRPHLCHEAGGDTARLQQGPCGRRAGRRPQKHSSRLQGPKHCSFSLSFKIRRRT